MTLKNYQKIKLFIVAIIAVIFSQSIIYKNYFIPITTLLVSTLLLLYLRKKVTEVIADERDYEIAGKSSLLSMQIYSWVAVISMFILYAFRDINPAYEPIAMTLAFSTCLLMLLYSFIFRYYHKIKLSDKKSIYLVIVIIFFIILTIATLRIFSGEDSWICDNGKWIEHGHPSFPAPNTECK